MTRPYVKRLAGTLSHSDEGFFLPSQGLLIHNDDTDDSGLLQLRIRKEWQQPR